MLKFITFTLFFIGSSFAAVLGDFTTQKILPGHITFDKSSPFYQGIENDEFHWELIDKKTPSQILESFFEDGRFSLAAFQNLEDQIDGFYHQTKKYFCIDELRKKLDSYDDCNAKTMSEKKFINKWNKSRYILAFDLLNEHRSYVKSHAHKLSLENLNSIDHLDFYDAFFSIIELYSALVQEERQNNKNDSAIKAMIKAKNFVADKDVIRRHTLHSSNLKNTNDPSKLFFSYVELEELVNNGFDISKLDPYDSEVWRRPKKSISEMNMTAYDRDGVVQLKEVFDKDFIEKFIKPDERIDIVFKGDSLSGGKTPKFDVFINDVKFKLKFITSRHRARPQDTPQSAAMRNLWGSEANVEPAVNQIAHAIGYNVDPTYFKHQVRFYIDEEETGMDFDETLVDLINRLHERYMIESNIDDAFSNIQVDENGRRFVLLKSVSLEQKTNEKTDMNIGFYRHMGLGKSLKREHRALYLFMAWIADPDIKDDNTKVKLVPYVKADGSQSFKVVLSNSDMGGAIGIGYPNLYNYDLVKKYKLRNGEVDSVRLRYMRLFDYNMKYAINFDDARWLVRRMSQLSVDQLKDTFIYAGYPEIVARYYALLMAKKRNQLIKVFGLAGDTFIDDGGKEFTIQLSEEFNGSIEGYEEFFRNGHFTDPENKLFNPAIENHPRYWGVSWRNRDTEDAQDNFLKDLGAWLLKKSIALFQKQIVDRSHLGVQGLNIYRRNLFLDDKLFSFGDGFLQGLDVGVMGLIPLRHIIENPDKSSDYPFIVLDVVRFGTYVSAYDPLFEKIGVKPEALGLEGLTGAKIFYMKEAIKVTPVKSLRDYFKLPYKTFNVQKLDWKRFITDEIDDLNPDHFYFVSHYVGAKAGMRIRPAKVMPLSSFTTGIGSIATKRYLLGSDDEKLYVRKAKENVHFFANTLNLFDLILKIPLLEYDFSWENYYDELFEFEKRSEREKFFECVENNFGPTCEDEKEKERQTLIKNNHFYAGLFGLVGFDFNRRYIYRNHRDLGDSENYYERIYQHENTDFDFKQIIGIEETLKTSIYTNSENEINLLVDLNYKNPATRSYEFKNLITKYEPLLSSDFMSLGQDIQQLYMGSLHLDVSIHFNHDALINFFDMSDMELCKQYALFTEKETVCNENFYEDRTISNLLNERRSAKFNYDIILKTDILYLKNKYLKRVAKFFMDKNFRYKLANFLIFISDKDNFRRDISFYSSANPFPNDMNEIKESNQDKGKMKKFKMKKFNFYGDDLIDSVSKFFYSQYSVY